MAGNKKPRKKYRPKRVLLNPVDHVIHGLSKISDNILVKLKTRNHLALSKMIRGNGTNEEWRVLCDALSIAEVLDRNVFLAQYAHEMEQAVAAHAACGNRKVHQGRLLYTGPEMQAVKLALEVHDAQLDVANVSEVEKALDEVIQRWNQIRRQRRG